MKIAELRELIARRPRVSLTQLPTPLQDCPRLTRELGGDVRILMKRDDLTMTGFGGNKIRKLEFSLGQVLADGCDVIVHGLAAQSNYCRQTAAACAKLGLPCHLVLRDDDEAGDPPQGNRLLDYIFGAKVLLVPAAEQQAAKDQLLAKLRAEGRKPYLIDYHDEALSAPAYCLCLAEIIEQSAALGVTIDYICYGGNNGTQAGLVLGKRLLGFAGEILAFDPSPVKDELLRRGRIARIATDAAARLGLAETFTAADIENTSDYSGPQYGLPTPAGLEAIGLLGRTEGLVVGPVYTAKGLVGLISGLRSGRLAKGRTALFLHTGGSPEVFAHNAAVATAMMRQDAPPRS